MIEWNHALALAYGALLAGYWLGGRDRPAASRVDAGMPTRPEPLVELVFGEGDIITMSRSEAERLVREIPARRQ
ncbi:hypothetical protein [Desulfocurvibacter africanus]|uniref:Uncharacterized protein n=1 Tax=Desulfocurvibacter africanus subsp. africanus str. Walvis Bay TaxID=690850 RepID=F3YVZ9_DESAF|nr:hypothetical protein [Desulfocurvibacter africanus]EGJ49029.1 hypothetical protein Desaf_0677 [Desulfocurvibacter africanus subsp. africanus str. Walvis Bay]